MSSEVSLDDLRRRLLDGQRSSGSDPSKEVYIDPDQNIVMGQVNNPDVRRLSRVPQTVFA